MVIRGLSALIEQLADLIQGEKGQLGLVGPDLAYLGQWEGICPSTVVVNENWTLV